MTAFPQKKNDTDDNNDDNTFTTMKMIMIVKP